ncbi:MAG: hypothetical protein ACK5NN_00325 [Sphingomonadaceae bacterium]
MKELVYYSFPGFPGLRKMLASTCAAATLLVTVQPPSVRTVLAALKDEDDVHGRESKT